MNKGKLRLRMWHPALGSSSENRYEIYCDNSGKASYSGSIWNAAGQVRLKVNRGP